MKKSNISLPSPLLDFNFNWLSRARSLRFNICLIGISYYTVILKSTCNIWFYRRHSLNKLIMQSWSTTKLNMDLWKWHMNLIKACASKWAELNHWTESYPYFDFTAAATEASTLWELPDSTEHLILPWMRKKKSVSSLFGNTVNIYTLHTGKIPLLPY